MKKEADIIIVGGGIAGLACACALAKYTSLSIILLERGKIQKDWSLQSYSYRVSALSLSTINILKNLNVWDKIASKRASPFSTIEVYENPTWPSLNFKSTEIEEPYLGCIIENDLLHQSLLEAANEYAQITIIDHVDLSHVQKNEQEISIYTHDNLIYSASLAIGADGACSFLREQSHISIQKTDYHQEAIVAQIKTKKKHGKVARQIFLPTGPLAFLPLLDEHHCSIVWSLDRVEANKIKKLSPEAFNAILYTKFNLLDEVELQGQRYTFSLYKQVANQYVSERIALIGDAAHVVHPLAGQGANLAMLDMASLVEVIEAALLKRKSFSSETALCRYQRWRKADNFPMVSGIDLIKKIYHQNNPLFTKLRQTGSTLLTNSAIKKFFTLQAVGKRTGLPRLAHNAV